MKKYIYLFITFIILVACSSDDNSDPATINTNSIVGVWTGEKEIDYNIDGSIRATNDYSLEPCYKMSTYTYKSDNTFIAKTYDYFGVPASCQANTIRNGQWEINSLNELNISGGNTNYENGPGELVKVLSVTNDTLKLGIYINNNLLVSETVYSKVR